MDKLHILLLFCLCLSVWIGVAVARCNLHTTKLERDSHADTTAKLHELQEAHLNLGEQLYEQQLEHRAAVGELEDRVNELEEERQQSLAAFLAHPWGPMAPVCQ